MTYMVCVNHRKGPVWITEALLDGIIPQRVVDLTTCEKAEEMDLCRICDSDGRRCHVLVRTGRSTYAKHCPVLWHDLFHPSSWRVEDLV
jgi:hypothetical protein